MEKNLNKLIKENLVNVKEKKGKKLLYERKIVKERIENVISVNKLKTKKDFQRAGQKLFLETINLQKEKFSNEVISEEFDFLNILGSGPLEVLKEAIVRGILKALNIDARGWIGDSIAIFVGNLNFRDIPKLTDCKFLTHIISKSILETAVDQLKQSKTNFNGFIGDALRSTIVDMLTENNFIKEFENKTLGKICDFNLKDKLGSFFSQMSGGESQTDKPSLSGLAVLNR
jgi:hypothetical protein